MVKNANNQPEDIVADPFNAKNFHKGSNFVGFRNRLQERLKVMRTFLKKN